MAYGFNNDKTKVEVYTKSEAATMYETLTNTIAAVGNQVGQKANKSDFPTTKFGTKQLTFSNGSSTLLTLSELNDLFNLSMDSSNFQPFLKMVGYAQLAAVPIGMTKPLRVSKGNFINGGAYIDGRGFAVSDTDGTLDGSHNVNYKIEYYE